MFPEPKAAHLWVVASNHLAPPIAHACTRVLFEDQLRATHARTFHMLKKAYTGLDPHSRQLLKRLQGFYTEPVYTQKTLKVYPMLRKASTAWLHAPTELKAK